MNKCGECRACCRALGVAELDKPEWQRCKHVCKAGCGIYEARPESCVKYSCLWLLSQSETDPLPPRLRPDRCGVIFDHMESMPENTYIARVAPGNQRDLRDPLVVKLMATLVDRGAEVIVRIGNKTSAPVRAFKSDRKPHTNVVIRGKL